MDACLEFFSKEGNTRRAIENVTNDRDKSVDVKALNYEINISCNQ